MVWALTVDTTALLGVISFFSLLGIIVLWRIAARDRLRRWRSYRLGVFIERSDYDDGTDDGDVRGGGPPRDPL